MHATTNTPDQRGYNGWTNYETWVVALWLGNDPGTDEMLRELTTGADTEHEAAEALKDFIEEHNPLADAASLYTDLLRAGISEVDWYEIASHYREDE